MAGVVLKNMWFKISAKLEKLIGIDLGTDRIRIWSKKSGFVFDEAACVAIDEQSERVLAIGDEALAMEGRVGEKIQVKWLMQDSSLVDPNLIRAFFKLVFKKIFGEFIFFKPITMISVPTNLIPTKKELLSEVFYELGMGEVFTISQPLAAAIGAGVPVADASGCFIVQLGAGSVECAVISMGRVVKSAISFKAGNFLGDKIAWEIKKNTLVEMGKQEIELIKKKISLSLPETSNPKKEVQHEEKIKATGNDLKSKTPREIEIDNQLLKPALLGCFSKYHQLIIDLLADLSPVLTTDVVDKGILLSGGLAQFHGLEEFLLSEITLSVSVVDEPDQTVIRGISMVLENIDLYRESLGYVS